MPPVYRQCAVSYTDFWSAYETVFPQKRYKAVGKETGMTNYIGGFNNTMRQRISRLVRKTLSFSKNSPIIWELFGILFMSITPVYISIKSLDFPGYAGLPLYVYRHYIVCFVNSLCNPHIFDINFLNQNKITVNMSLSQ